ncbi:MAG TPA: endonuclease/exonuclease/phosphatase family protein, partial [Longimicrobiales bacterium]|nr:endonuclease/exonuclease/phosphatase family protein [Longimicrobiales bacterium]
MSRFSRLACSATALLVVSACDVAVTAPPLSPGGPDPDVFGSPGLTVMTQNLYVGADFSGLLSGADPSTVLAEILAALQHTNFGARASALAMEIVTSQAQLVGLQEVSRFELPAGLGFPTELDYLTILMAYIQAYGGDYVVAAQQPELQLTIPIVLNGIPVGTGTYQDRDVILARSDVQVEDALGGWYSTQQIVSVGGASFPFLRGWAAVTATAAGQTIRFVTTHLEVQQFRPVPEEQARELAALFADDPHPVVMVGDFNSAANPHAADEERSDSYHILRNAGYEDLWLREPHSVGGPTCCNAVLLDNLEPDMHSRLDLVLARYGPAGFGGRSDTYLVGEEPDDRIDLAPGYTLWPSDHAGVVATLWPAPG